MSRTGIHKTTHLHRMAFIGETIYQPNDNRFESVETKVQKGCRVAGAVLKAAEDPEEQNYLNGVFTPAILGSAWQDSFVDDFTRGPNDLMYRVIGLPQLASVKDNTDLRDETWRAGVTHVEAAGKDRPVAYAHVRIDAHTLKIMRTRQSYRALGLASLWLGAVEIAGQIESGNISNGTVIQDRVRESGYNMTERALKLAQKIGILPTIGQLDEAYSPLTVEFMRSGPSHLRDAFNEAREATHA